MQVVNQADAEEKMIIKTKLKDNKFGLNQNQKTPYGGEAIAKKTSTIQNKD